MRGPRLYVAVTRQTVMNYAFGCETMVCGTILQAMAFLFGALSLMIGFFSHPSGVDFDLWNMSPIGRLFTVMGGTVSVLVYLLGWIITRRGQRIIQRNPIPDQ